MNIYIINLASQTERKEAMQKQFEMMNDEIRRQHRIIFFNAVNAAAGEHLGYKQYNRFAALLCRGKEMSAGERACFASHYRLWHTCVELDSPIVVLEDDVRLKENFWQEITRVEQSALSYVRFMYLKKQPVFWDMPLDFKFSFENLAGTQGYYLTPRAARAFLSRANIWYRPVDDYMDMFYLHKVPNVCIAPILSEIDIQSNIGDRSKKPPFYLKIAREISRFLRHIYAYLFLRWRSEELLLPQEYKKDLLRYINTHSLKGRYA